MGTRVGGVHTTILRDRNRRERLEICQSSSWPGSTRRFTLKTVRRGDRAPILTPRRAECGRPRASPTFAHERIRARHRVDVQGSPQRARSDPAGRVSPALDVMADAPKAVTTVAKGSYDEVVVHPLVLLSVVDHFRRCDEVRRRRRRATTTTTTTTTTTRDAGSRARDAGRRGTTRDARDARDRGSLPSREF